MGLDPRMGKWSNGRLVPADHSTKIGTLSDPQLSHWSGAFSIRIFILAGASTGFLPQIQLHSSIVLAQYSGVLCFLTFDKRKIKQMIPSGPFSRSWRTPLRFRNFSRTSGAF
jgi:hypothetical protein